ncbi:hypothetical protein [Streptomyces sp. NBC_01744]|uniref:hypothetical protein n=1 Tax=Streptomyces sp. NBC_01744 TaxID=2975927 RepID=UPI003D9AB4C2|nr:hypothetical protein OIE70_05500 [Streptomyces sp. NBC_01744]
MSTRTRRLAVALLVVLAACWGTYQWLASEFRQAKDRRDLHNLTRSLPWANETLLVPDAVRHETDAMAWANAGSFKVTFRKGPQVGGHGPMIEYAMHRKEEDGSEPVDVVSCGATKIVTCTDLGHGLRQVVTHDTDSSDPALALYQDAGSLLITVRGYDGPLDVSLLRDVLAHTHRPTDDELLSLLRPPGYQTDWR